MRLIEGDKLPTITTERLRLRWIELADAQAMFEIFSNAQAMRYWCTTPWVEPSEGVEFVESVQRCFCQHTLFEWAVVTADSDKPIGTCTLASIDTDHRRAEIGFMLRPEFWGRGYMTEAVAALLDFSFSTLRLHRIEADVDPRNDASLRLLERLGFRREGRVRERWHVGDEINDGIILSLLRHEYAPSTRSALDAAPPQDADDTGRPR
ncbi:MAG TPA: GNAT family N-acetyltransferase [Phycisphaerae bacterium]|nr:GNAT family N-acetyltransferase [Phycisphaerae bacterium]HRW55346.1 GNAT family N-acetyltransferase [Phycisphaerae bacterium]